MQIPRRFTEQNSDVYSTVQWSKRSSKITNSDGSVVFEMHEAEIPAQWSQLAADIMTSKYFRKAGVPAEDGSQDENKQPKTGPETSAKQVIHRLAGCWKHWGEQHGYFASEADAQTFYDEVAYMLLHQMAAPNSPQWFNTGLNWAYGITGPAQGHWVTDPRDGQTRPAPDAYTHPQPHACFIQAVRDDLVNDDGIMGLWTREARLFKYGSGTGTNFSSLRGENEPLSGGGKSSGLMSFLKIGDRAAGAIKSGGTTRRAAKMVCLDADHPDIEEFINWKVREELKVAAMVEGMKHLTTDQKELAESLGLKLNYDFNGEAYYTVSGQNSNNSIRLTDAFFDALDEDDHWRLFRRTDGEVARTIPARDLWAQLNDAAWRCADPGVQYDSTINAWHTCPASGRITASNPCSEYMFLDNTACNLASINLLKFYDAESRSFDNEGFEHAIRLWTIVLEISVLMAAFPSREVAEQSYRFRTLGLGYANLGAMLMQAGIAYDSEQGRAMCGAISSILTGRSYATSASMAGELGAFPGFAENREPMMRVIRNHRRAARGVSRDDTQWEDLRIRPVSIDHALFENKHINIQNADTLLARANAAWDDALVQGEKHGYRNAQTSVIAPTGTIGLLMDCDTTGVEPDFALTKFKKLAGGGHFKIANQSLRPALAALNYSSEQIDDIMTHVMGTLSVDSQLPAEIECSGESFRDFLTDSGYTPDEIVEVEHLLPTVFELRIAFNAWAMPQRILDSLGIDASQAREDQSFNGLRALGLTPAQIAELNQRICGTQTVENAPHLKDEHLPVFDCANTCGATGKRFIASEGHIRMMGAAQPFISGAISKTINLPADATVDDIAHCYRLGWELGLKANALYRDGCKLSQPLNTKSDRDDELEDEDAVSDALDEVTTDVSEAVTVVAGSPEETDGADTPQPLERIVERIVERPLRRRLPDTRDSLTHKFNVAGHEGYLIVGLYKTGSPGELFITMAKEGSTIGGLMDSLGTAISVALQYGVPIESLVTKFAHQRFEPMGMTTNPEIPFAKSLVDYIFRWLGMNFISGYREKNAPQRNKSTSHAYPVARNNSQLREDTQSWSDNDNSPQHDTRDSKPANTVTNGNGRPPTDGPTNTAQRTVRVNPSAETDTAAPTTPARSATAMDSSNAALMGDAPACDTCGAITVRNGTCYKCLNCGNSMGCS